MNQFKKLFAVSMLLSIAHVNADTVSGKSFFLPRAQNGTADAIFGQTNAIHKYDTDHIYGVFKSQTGYYQSFSNSKIGKYLFFNGNDVMTIGGQETTAVNSTTDIMNSNLLLSSWYTGTIQAAPKVQTLVSSFDLFVGFNEWVDGLWFQVQAPLVWTKFNVNLTDLTSTPSTNQTQYVGQFDTAAAIPAAGVASVPPLPYTSAAAAFAGTATYGDQVNAWQYGRVQGSQSTTKLGDVHMTLGYDFVLKENMHFGLGIHALLGAGGKSKAQYMFEPVVGYAGRFGVGGTIDAAMRLWERDEDHQFTAWLHGDVYTVFDNSQVRSFDLNSTMGGVGSRYNLVKKMTGLTGTAVYSGEMNSMINIGTQTAKIGMDVAYDVTLMFIYQHGNFTVDFGYTAAGHSAEKFKSWVTSITPNTYVLWTPLEANTGVVNATSTTAITSFAGVTVSGLATGAALALTTAANVPTCVIDNSKLNQDSALAPSAMGNVIFGGVNYCWMDNDWAPCLGGGASVEFSGNGNKTLDMWGIFLQGNVSF